MYKKRAITARLRELVKHFRIVVVTGARQVGKSTLLKHEFGDISDYVLFDPLIDKENARREPELFLKNHRTPVILDEIQYAPEITSVLKRIVDEDKTPGQYLLTGSQQWAVIKNMAESLAGRAVFLDLDSFSLSELADDVASTSWLEDWLTDPKAFLTSPKKARGSEMLLGEQLFRGFFPEPQTVPISLVPNFYQAYVETYLERDVRAMADLNNLQTFSYFMQLAAALSAQEINFSTLGRELGLSPLTAKHWISILESTFQWVTIPAFSGNVLKRVSLKRKGYFTDTGLLCHLQALSSPRALPGHPLWGAIFETAVVAEIRKMSHAMGTAPIMYHWRKHSGAEVDLILERDGVLFPIEIKASTRIETPDARGISSFREAYPHLKIGPGLVIAPVEKMYPITATDYAMPWDCA